MLVILLGTLAAVQALAASPLWTGGADAAGWLSAVGTIGTFIYAIILANSQERQRRHEARTVAQVFAAGLDADMNHAIDLLFSNEDHFARLSNGDELVFRGTEVLKRFLAIRQIDTKDLAVLVPLQDGFAVKLADAQGRLNLAKRRFERIFTDFAPTTLELPKIKELGDWNEYVLRPYADLKILCQNAANELRKQTVVKEDAV